VHDSGFRALREVRDFASGDAKLAKSDEREKVQIGREI